MGFCFTHHQYLDCQEQVLQIKVYTDFPIADSYYKASDILLGEQLYYTSSITSTVWAVTSVHISVQMKNTSPLPYCCKKADKQAAMCPHPSNQLILPMCYFTYTVF